MDRARHLIDLARQLIVFLLGVALILDAITSPTQQIAQLVAGLVMLGLAPIDGFISRVRRNGRGGP